VGGKVDQRPRHGNLNSRLFFAISVPVFARRGRQPDPPANGPARASDSFENLQLTQESLSMTTTADAFADRVFASALGAIDIYSIHIGNELGFYKTLRREESMSAPALAAATGVAERYAREWLEQQATSGILTVDQSGDTDMFVLPSEHADVLADELNGSYLVPLARMLSTSGMNMERLLDAYRSDSGVSWDEFGRGMRHSQADMNRPFFQNDLSKIVSGIPSAHQRMSRVGARVADVGCGAGWSTIALAEAYPDAMLTGFDIDHPSIEMAVANADEAGVSERVSFSSADIIEVDEHYDLAFAFECIHDMSQPVPVLAAMRRMVGDTGIVVVMDEAVGEEFTGTGGDVEKLMYGFSLLVCLPDGLSSRPSVGTGTVIRPPTLQAYARDAGFTRFASLTEAGFFRFYELAP
jgi:SAM-dependent methyltransferase